MKRKSSLYVMWPALHPS